MDNHQASGEPKTRVLVADSSYIHTRLLADVLKRDSLMEVIPFDSDSRGLVAAVMAQNIHVLVISSNLEEEPSRGFEVLRELHALCPDIRAVVLLNSSKREAVVNAFRSGARGVFCKNEPVDLLCKCVRCVHHGEIWASNRELLFALEALAIAPAIRATNAEGMSLLSKRELEVVRSLAEGLTNREIAERLDLSQHTVKNYLFRVFDKLGVSSRVELLFMTMSEPGLKRPRVQNGPAHADHGRSSNELAMLQKAAEAGLPAAQLALAQLLLSRRTGPQDLVLAYMWYLVASERASQVRGLMTRMLTPKQIDEAEQEARSWLARLKGTSPAATEEVAQSKLAARGEDPNL